MRAPLERVVKGRRRDHACRRAFTLVAFRIFSAFSRSGGSSPRKTTWRRATRLWSRTWWRFTKRSVGDGKRWRGNEDKWTRDFASIHIFAFVAPRRESL